MAKVIDMLTPSPAIAARHAAKLVELGRVRAMAEWLTRSEVSEAARDQRRREHLEASLIRDMKAVAAHALAVGDIAWARALIARVATDALAEIGRDPAETVHLGEH